MKLGGGPRRNLGDLRGHPTSPGPFSGLRAGSSAGSVQALEGRLSTSAGSRPGANGRLTAFRSIRTIVMVKDRSSLVAGSLT